MALATQGSNLAWQKVKAALANANPATQAAFQGLKRYLAEQKGNPDLQFVPYLSTSVDDANGHDLGIDAACTLYAFYGKKAATTTDVYLYVFDDASNDAGAGTDGRMNLVFLAASDEAFSMMPNGMAIVDGIVIKAYTDFDGTTDSVDTDCPNGFVLLGA